MLKYGVAARPNMSIALGMRDPLLRDSNSKGDFRSRRGDLDPRLMHHQGMELSGLSGLRAPRGRRRASVEEDATGSKERARRMKVGGLNDESRTATGRRESDSVDSGGDGTLI